MHELSIARGLVEVACEALAQSEPPAAGRVRSLRVLVGALAGVVPEALEFCYTLTAKGTPLEGSRLVIQPQPVVVFCPRCLENRTLTDVTRFRCPACNTPTPELVHGRELDLLSMELADDDEPNPGPTPSLDPDADTDPGPGTAPDLEVRRGLLRANDELARDLREGFARAGVYVVNVVAGPGAGKTELLARTLSALLARGRRAAAVVGDLATENDAVRLRATGAEARQVVTGTVCHLDAAMVRSALDGLDLAGLDYLFIENVGNLVCPAAFDLGEALRVLLFPVTEGEDKPLKYPSLINTVDLTVISKVDLADAVGFDRPLARRNLDLARPGAPVLETSARTGQGVDAWVDRLEALRTGAQAPGPSPPGA